MAALYTFNFMISGELTVWAKTEEQATTQVNEDLAEVKIGRQTVFATVEVCDLESQQEEEEEEDAEGAD